MIYNNIIIEEQVYHDFFFGEKVKGKALTVLEKTGLFHDLFRIYSDYSGAETGYGFYAPNVSSQFMVLYTIKDSLDQPVRVGLPQYYSKEALMRYFTAFDLFMDKIGQDDEKYDQFMDIVMKSMALRVLEEHAPYTRIEADLLVYDLPYMPEYRNGERPEYAHILHYDYQLEN